MPRAGGAGSGAHTPCAEDAPRPVLDGVGRVGWRTTHNPHGAKPPLPRWRAGAIAADDGYPAKGSPEVWEGTPAVGDGLTQWILGSVRNPPGQGGHSSNAVVPASGGHLGCRRAHDRGRRAAEARIEPNGK